MKWSFNRLIDGNKINTETIEWSGPYSWPKYESVNGLPKIPDLEGVYLFTFEYKNNFVVYAAGITNSTKKRISAHTREYRKGNYTVLDVGSAEKGERKEIWHGWQYAKSHQEEYQANKSKIDSAIDTQLSAFRIFITEIPNQRKRERLEAGIMQNIYISKEPWSELADRGMYLKGRYNSEIPIIAKNINTKVIYGLPNFLEI